MTTFACVEKRALFLCEHSRWHSAYPSTAKLPRIAHLEKKKVHPLAKHLRSTWKRIETYEKLPVKQQIQLKEARCWNVSVLYGHCPNSLAPPSVKQANVGKKYPKPSRQAFTLPPLRAMPHGNNTFQKGAFLRWAAVGLCSGWPCLASPFIRFSFFKTSLWLFLPQGVEKIEGNMDPEINNNNCKHNAFLIK